MRSPAGEILAALAEGAELPLPRAADLASLRAALVGARALAATGPVFVHLRTRAGAAPTPYFRPDAAVLSDRCQQAIRG